MCPGAGLLRVRAAIDRLDPHALHQRRDMAAADRNALAVQKVAQHPAARERVVQMQFVDPPHDRQDPRPRPAEACNRRLPRLMFRAFACRGIGRSCVAVDHRFALSMPALVSAPSKKSFSSVSSPILACSAFKSTAGAAGLALVLRRKRPAAPSSKLAFPLRDLVRMDIELLRQFGQRLLALDGGQSHLRLEGRCVVPAGALRHLLS